MQRLGRVCRQRACRDVAVFHCRQWPIRNWPGATSITMPPVSRLPAGMPRRPAKLSRGRRIQGHAEDLRRLSCAGQTRRGNAEIHHPHRDRRTVRYLPLQHISLSWAPGSTTARQCRGNAQAVTTAGKQGRPQAHSSGIRLTVLRQLPPVVCLASGELESRRCGTAHLRQCRLPRAGFQPVLQTGQPSNNSISGKEIHFIAMSAITLFRGCLPLSYTTGLHPWVFAWDATTDPTAPGKSGAYSNDRRLQYLPHIHRQLAGGDWCHAGQSHSVQCRSDVHHLPPDPNHVDHRRCPACQRLHDLQDLSRDECAGVSRKHNKGDFGKSPGLHHKPGLCPLPQA